MGPSCSTLEIYHKASMENKDSVVVEKAEVLLCPACGMACTSAAGLHAHMAACHAGLQVRFHPKGEQPHRAAAAGGGKTRWKMLVSPHAQAEQQVTEQRSRDWHQNFLFWVRYFDFECPSQHPVCDVSFTSVTQKWA